MFTGIIEELGTIRGVSLTKDGGELQIAPPPYWAAQSWGTALPSTVPV